MGAKGLKENVIIGKLIPAGTGMKCYRSVKLNTETAKGEELVLSEELEEGVNPYETASAAADELRAEEDFEEEFIDDEYTEEEVVDAE